MRSNITSTIANVFTRFGVIAVDMLRAGNDSASMSWRLQLCTAGPLSGRHSGANLLLGNMNTVSGKRGNHSISDYLPAITEPTLSTPSRTQETAHSQQTFQRLS